MKHYVYGLYTKNQDKPILFYVGISSGDRNLYFRKKNHRNETANPHKLAVIRKYDFDLQIIWTVDSREEAENREEFLIRWFGDQLTNIAKHSKDLSRAKSKPKKPKGGWKKHSKEAILANRNRNLTIPYNKIMALIEEWGKNPLESQTDFAMKNNISRSKFKDWIRLYKPEYIGLTKKVQKEIYNKVYSKNKSPTTIIRDYAFESGYSITKAKGIYYRLSKVESSVCDRSV